MEVTTVPARRSRTLVFSTICVAFAVMSLEGLSLLAIALSARVSGEEIRRTADIFREQTAMIERLLGPGPRLLQLDPDLGWRYRSNYRDSQNQINSQGVRSGREYSAAAGADVVRIAAFGDSFVYCNEVANEGSWPTQMEAMFPTVEVLNYGVGGYGTDQAFLHYRQRGSLLSPEVVIIGFAPDDLRRVVNVYRRFISNRELPLVKPRFVLDSDGQLVLIPPPIRGAEDYGKYLREPSRILELGRHDQWYRAGVYENPFYDYLATIRVGFAVGSRIYDRYLDPDRLLDGDVFNGSSTAFRIQAALVQTFARDVIASGALPIVVIFPDRDSIARGREGKPRVSDPLVEHARRKQIPIVDLTEAFAAESAGVDATTWFMPGGHYSPSGNRLVAIALERQIGELLHARGAASPRDPTPMSKASVPEPGSF